MGCPHCTGAPFWSVVPPGPCGLGCVYWRAIGFGCPYPTHTLGYPYPTHPAPRLANPTNTLGTGAGESHLSDDDVERIARRVADLLRTTPGQ